MFTKGQGRIAGRQKGTPNKSSANLKSKIESIVNCSFETIEDDLQDMDARDRVGFILKLIPYLIPTQKEQKINFNEMSDSEINALIDRLKNPE